jgi:hypothetical protein
MFGGLLPAPGEVPLPIAIALVLLDLPFLAALYLQTAAGHSSPTVTEVIAVAIPAGAVIASTLAAAVLGVRRILTHLRPAHDL